MTWKTYSYGLTVKTNRIGEIVNGRSQLWFKQGIAIFTDLSIKGSADPIDNFRLLFTSCNGAPEVECESMGFEAAAESYMAVTSASFIIGASKPYRIMMYQQPRGAVVNEVIGGVCESRTGVTCVKMVMTYPVKVSLVDVLENKVITGKWYVCTRLKKNGVTDTSDALRGNARQPVVNGIAVFDDMSVLTDSLYWTLNFTVHDGSIFDTCTDPYFSQVESTTFVISFNTADGLRVVAQPSTAVAGTELLPPPQVAFVDKLGNIVTAANCPGSSANALAACGLKITIQIAQITGGINRLRGIDDLRFFLQCGPNQINAIGACTERTRNDIPVILGISNFTNVALHRAGSYRLTFFSQLLITSSTPFYVKSTRPTYLEGVIFPGASTCRLFNASSDPRCEFGGNLDPPPTLKLWDRFDNLCVDGSFRVMAEILANPGKGLLVCPGGTTVRCFAQSQDGLVVFPGMSIDQMGIGYSLHISIPGDGVDSVGLSAVVADDTTAFNLYALREQAFDTSVSITSVGCPIYPFPKTRLIGYNPSKGLSETDLTTIPVDDGSISVQGLSCVSAPTGDVTVASNTLPQIRGTYARLGVVKGQPIYQQKVSPGFFIYVCDGSYNRSGCGNRFWAMSTNLSYCNTSDVSSKALLLLQNCKDTDKTPDLSLQAWYTRSVQNGVATWSVTDSYSVVIKESVDACNSQNTLWGSTVEQYVGGHTTFRDVKLNTSGTYMLRFITTMTGSTKSVAPLDASYDVIKNVLSSVDVVQQPQAVKNNFLTPYPPRVVVRDFTESPVFGWSCVVHKCSSLDKRFNISAEIWRTSPVTGEAVGILPATLVSAFHDPITGYIEFGFTPEIAEKNAFVRFTTTSESSCGEQQQGLSVKVVRSVLFDIFGLDPTEIRVSKQPPATVVAGKKRALPCAK